jgi:hypothetical protein
MISFRKTIFIESGFVLDQPFRHITCHTDIQYIIVFICQKVNTTAVFSFMKEFALIKNTKPIINTKRIARFFAEESRSA